MENPSPTDGGRGQESTGAGPSGSRDGDDSPITVQGDNLAEGRQTDDGDGYRNVRQRISPPTQFVHPGQQHGTSPSPSPSSDSWPSTFSDWQQGSTSSNTHAGPLTVVRTVPADTTSDDGSPSIESARIGTPTTSPSPSSSPPAFQQDVSTSTLAAPAVHVGASFPPVVRRGGRTAPNSQVLGAQNPMGGGRGRGGWRASLQLVDAVPDLVVDIRQTVDAVTQTVLRETLVSLRHTFEVVLEPEPEPEPEPQPIPVPIPIPIPSSDEEWRRLVGAKCPVCERDLVGQPGILPATASLPCGHVFHADCLNPEGSSNTPIPCPACPTNSDSS